METGFVFHFRPSGRLEKEKMNKVVVDLGKELPNRFPFMAHLKDCEARMLGASRLGEQGEVGRLKNSRR